MSLAEKWNKKDGEIDKLNQLMKILEGERHNYLSLVKNFKHIKAAAMIDKPELAWPSIIFDHVLTCHGLREKALTKLIINVDVRDKLCFSCWHVYRAEPTHSAH